MEIEEEIERVGGLVPIGSVQFSPIRREDLELLLSRSHIALPPSNYVDFITKYGSCSTAKETCLDLPNCSAEYVHPVALGLQNPGHNRLGLAHFYGADQSTKTLSLRWALETYASRTPEGFLPIADDGAGNQYCWGPTLAGQSAFHWWDHENEWDAEDYEDDTGETMSPEVKYQNVYLVASSFGELIQMFKTVD